VHLVEDDAVGREGEDLEVKIAVLAHERCPLRRGGMLSHLLIELLQLLQIRRARPLHRVQELVLEQLQHAANLRQLARRPLGDEVALVRSMQQ